MFKPCSLHSKKRRLIIFITRYHCVISQVNEPYHIHSYDLLYSCAVLPLTHHKWLELLNYSSSSNIAWEGNQSRFSHLFNCNCDIGVCQRLFWPQAVCFQDIETSTGGILLYYIFTVVAFSVSNTACLVVVIKQRHTFFTADTVALYVAWRAQV